MGSLGKYTLIEQLGSGSMGTVYLARDTVLDRKVALKTIRTDVAVDEEVRVRFIREAKTCARLQHPSIVVVFDMGEESGFAYISMELLLGCDFKKHIEQHTDLALVTKLEAMIQICGALDHAHREGIVHRDIKPSNLFLTTDYRAKVLDFGIARLPSSRLTVVGRVLGTPNYMAPEQILGNKSDGRADLFSAAVVFFELLVHHHPFQSSLIPRRIIDTDPDSIFDYDSSIPLPFEQIFKQALHKDPEKRYATASQFAADIRAVLDGVRQNASPTFSSVNLPSTRVLPTEPPPETPIFNDESETGDPAEQRLSEFLRLLPYFEKAVDREAYDDAIAALERLRAIEAVDSRFVESIRICEDRLAAINPSARLSPDSSVSDGNFECACCDALNRGTAAFCFECGAARVPDKGFKPSSIPSHSASADETNLFEDVTIFQKPASSVSSNTTPKLRLGSPSLVPKSSSVFAGFSAGLTRISTALRLHGSAISPPSRIPIEIIIGAAVAIVLVLMLVALLTRGAVQPFVATAKVGPTSAQIFRNNDQSKPVATAPPGTLLNILKKPDPRSSSWFNIQWVTDGKPKTQGYVRRSTLRDFDSKDPDTLLQFARSGGPGDSGTIAELIQQIAAYQSVQDKFPGSKAAQAASEDAAKLNSALARLRGAEHPVNLAPTEALPQAPASAVQLPAPPAVSPQQELARARELAATYSYDRALRALKRVLAVDPHNQEALDLQEKIKGAKDAEDKVR